MLTFDLYNFSATPSFAIFLFLLLLCLSLYFDCRCFHWESFCILYEEQLVTNDLKHICNICPVFSTSLKVLCSILFRKLLAFFKRHLFLIIKVHHSSNKCQHVILGLTCIINILDPFFKIVKAFHTRQTETNKDRICILVIHWGQRSEAFFTSCVPQLQFYVLFDRWQ